MRDVIPIDDAHHVMATGTRCVRDDAWRFDVIVAPRDERQG